MGGGAVKKNFLPMIKKAPPGHRLVETEDGSVSFYSEKFQENGHSTSGAREETLLHYIQGCEILEKSLHHSPLHILEVGFGLGVGFLTTLEVMPQDRKWLFVSLESEIELLDWFIEQHPEFSFYWQENLLCVDSTSFQLRIIYGDARAEYPKFIQQYPIKFHAIYQDAFSPKKSPSLWATEWFSLLKTSAHPEVTLSTYSSSSSIRKSLHQAGWTLFEGGRFGKKRSSTRARLVGTTSSEILQQLQRSPAKAIEDHDLI